jgi:DNA-binding IclR family transcriptional regulator
MLPPSPRPGAHSEIISLLREYGPRVKGGFLAHSLGMSLDRVKNCLQRLEAEGVVVREGDTFTLRTGDV